MAEKKTYATGRIKSSIARVWVFEGKGEILVNGKSLLDYFGREVLKMVVEQPLEVIEKLGSYDVVATVNGGGHSGQAGAMRLGIARALKIIDPEVRSPLRAQGLLTRDPRRHERKKYGLAKRRKSFQFSKR